MLCNKYQLAGLKSLVVVSLFFAFLPLTIIGINAPRGLQVALLLGGSYFVPLVIWTLLLAEPVGRLAMQNRFYAFLFPLGGIGFAITCSWALGSFINSGAGPSAYTDSMKVSLPAFALLLFFAVPIALISGLFFLGYLERLKSK